MPATVAELDALFRALDQARGRRRFAACQQFCRAVIGAQRRGELGILPAAAWIEAALQYPELEADDQAVHLRERAAALQSPLRAVAHDLREDWRGLVKRIEQMTR